MLLPPLLAASACLPVNLVAAKDRDTRKPNIIFILADDLGYNDLGSYGQKRIQTPNLDRMAREGMRFTQFYCGSPVCAPSRSVLMTGLHTGHTTVRGNARVPLRPQDVTVAEVMKTAGYATGLVGKWGLGDEGTPGVPTKQGFDSFYGYLNQTHAHNYYPTFLLRNEERVKLRNVVPNEGKVGQGVASKKLDYTHDLFTNEALDYVDRNREKPFFLYLAYTIPHTNNEAKAKGMEVPDLGIYADRDWPESEKAFAAMITRMDRDIGRLMDRLKRNGIDDDTLVLFTSDNGPHREGGHNPDFFDSNGILRGIKRDLYEGGIRVPMIARWPGRIRAGSVTDRIGYFADIMPTAAQIAGVKPPKNDGESLLPTLLGKDRKRQPTRPLYWEFYEGGTSQAARMDRWKAVRKPIGGPVELYDLSADPGETRNIAERNPSIVKKLAAYMDRAHTPSPHWKTPDEQLNAGRSRRSAPTITTRRMTKTAPDATHAAPIRAKNAYF
ncbi:MAG: arylsulfatase [Armatimonadetes bacterium]|nr:arylsulfatase [Armatimonadota bacterium]